MKTFIDLRAIDAAYIAYYDSACEMALAEEQAWADFASAALFDNEEVS